MFVTLKKNVAFTMEPYSVFGTLNKLCFPVGGGSDERCISFTQCSRECSKTWHVLQEPELTLHKQLMKEDRAHCVRFVYS